MPEAFGWPLIYLLPLVAGAAWWAVGTRSRVVRVVVLGAWSTCVLGIVAARAWSEHFRRVMADLPAGTRVESVPYRPESSAMGLTCEQVHSENPEAIDWDKRAPNVTWTDPVLGYQWTYVVETGAVSCEVNELCCPLPTNAFLLLAASLVAAAAFIGALPRVSWRLLRALLRRRTAEGS